jgi:hypothetical protein
MKTAALLASGDLTILVCLLQKQAELLSESEHFGSGKKPAGGVARFNFITTD